MGAALLGSAPWLAAWGAPWPPARTWIAVLGVFLGLAMSTSWLVALVVFLKR